ADRVPVACRGLQRAGRGRELRLPGAGTGQVDRWAHAYLRLRVQRRRRAAALLAAARWPARGDAWLRAPVPVRSAERASLRDAERRPADARGQHASRLGGVRGPRQPRDRGRALARIRRRQPDPVARATAATGRDRLRRPPPLLVLGRPLTTSEEDL